MQSCLPSGDLNQAHESVSEGQGGQAAARSSQRDTAIEEEIFKLGTYADVVFKFVHPERQVEVVYGKAALFAVLSKQLHDKLVLSSSTDGQQEAGIREVWLDSSITARGFREVARYVYGLEPQWSFEVLPEVMAAAQALDLQELETWAFDRGIEMLSEEAAREVSGDSPPTAGTAGGLRCLDILVHRQPDEVRTFEVWRSSLLNAHCARRIFECDAFLKLSLPCMEALLEASSMHDDTRTLWEACLRWARSTHVQPPPCDKQRRVTRKLVGVGSRLLEYLEPAKPDESEVRWQWPLLTIVKYVRFSDMDASDFANYVFFEPMLPDLKKAIYSARRERSLEQVVEHAN